MTIRNLDRLFRPRSVALIGASTRPSSIGAVLARNVFRGDFDGPILPVNPKHRYLHGVWTYPDVASLPATPELAVIATPPQTVPSIVAELGARGTRAAVVITAGFAEASGGDGEALQQAMLDAARPHDLRIVGPNCLGILVPGIGLNASFAHLSPRPGRLAFVTQSGATVTAILDWAAARGIGFSHLVSLGDMADVDFGDMLDYLANDRDTQAILLYVEAVCDGRKFMSAARAAARVKPVIVVKAGRHAEGARAAASHTGALAGADAVYDAVFRRAGMLRVYTLEELFDAAETLGMGCRPRGNRLAVLTNGGGIGVLAADAVVEAGARLAELSAETLTGLDAVLPRTWSHANPVDIIGDAPASRYAQALRLLTRDKGVDALLVLHCPTAISSATEAAQAVVDTHQRDPGPLLLTSWVGETAVAEGRRLFAAQQVPTYATPEQAVRAFMHMVNYRRNQETLMETPPSVPEDFAPDAAAAQRIIAQALGEERPWLGEHEAKALLGAYGVPAVPTRLARTADEAAAIAAQLGGAVVLKIVSPDVVHKSDIGGVALDLVGPTAVKAAAAAMRERILQERPEARLDGFSVQPMVRRPGAYELIVGATEDRQFGPVLLFGQGGTSAELVRDQALALPPLNLHLAHEVMSRTRVYELLQGYRGAPAANLEAVAITLMRIAQLLIDHAEIRELDVNPLLADPYGVIALDARVRVGKATRPAADRLAIRPYPRELEEEIPLGDGRTLLLRPIRPEDEPSLQAAFANMTAEEIRLRFLVPVKTLTHVAAVRFTQLDYDREMGLILTVPGIPGRTEIYGVVNIIADPDNERAEYAIIVRHDMTALGLGMFLMRRIVDYARARGIREIYGDVLHENRPMLRLCSALGFAEARVPDEPSLVRVTLKL
jgi:acetyltransferase